MRGHRIQLDIIQQLRQFAHQILCICIDISCPKVKMLKMFNHYGPVWAI